MLPHNARTVAQLKAVLATGAAAHFIYFWRHTETDANAPTSGVLSQWFPSPFVVDGVRYATAEHWMMVSKAKLFGDDKIACSILADDSPSRAQRLGRNVRGFQQELWELHRFRIVRDGNLHKFTSSAALQTYLIGTGNAVLVEASPMDRVWGIGLSKNDAVAVSPNDWRGANLLGFALMAARQQMVEHSTP